MVEHARSRTWEVEINYFSETDIRELTILLEATRYHVIGFEGCVCTCFHPHLHCLLYFDSAKTGSRILKYFSKHHHIDVVKYPREYVAYCMGYDKGKPKCPHINDEFRMECGDKPLQFEQKDAPITSLVADAIQEGASLTQLKEQFPKYMLQNYSKVQTFMNHTVPSDKETAFYYVDNKRFLNYVFDKFAKEDIAVVQHLSYLALPRYSNKKIILLADISQYTHIEIQSWTYGSPIAYKVGYQFVEVFPEIFIIAIPEYNVTNFKHYYNKL